MYIALILKSALKVSNRVVFLRTQCFGKVSAALSVYSIFEKHTMLDYLLLKQNLMSSNKNYLSKFQNFMPFLPLKGKSMELKHPLTQ